MSDRTPERVIPAGRWRQFATMLGGIFAQLVGRRADERASDELWERSLHTWSWYVGGEKHSFTGTPADYRRYLQEEKK